MAALNEHFLIGAFADYYQELAIAKRAISAGKLSDYLGVRLMEKPADDSTLVAMLYKRLKAKLTQQQRFIRSNASALEQRDYLKVLYAACALTDEQFLFDLDWDQQKKWQEHYLLERAFFSSEDAGFRVFSHIDEIVADRSRINNRSDLSAVYLLTLTLGFRGKHRDWSDDLSDAELLLEQNLGSLGLDELGARRNEFLNTRSRKDLGPIETEKQKLYRVLDKPLEQDRVFAQAYEYLLFVTEDPSVHRIAPLRQWYKYAAYTAVAYLVVSSIAWVTLTSGIKESIQSLRSDSYINCDAVVTASDTTPQSTNATGDDSVNGSSVDSNINPGNDQADQTGQVNQTQQEGQNAQGDNPC